MKVGIIGELVEWEKVLLLDGKDHNVLIGSRDAKRANHQLKNIRISKRAFGFPINGISQVQITQQLLKNQNSSLSIPMKILMNLLRVITTINDNCVVVSPIVPMTKTKPGFKCVAIKENKPFSHQTVEKHMKDKTKLVSAFHVISEKKLVNPTLKLD
ncbi:MAG: hypothetical protein Ct9H300mP17_12280 [Candidatus Nitrosopelagicus sp.]|nr:MAG: hypothetical protein Ct9H300mP17_12280 [Candidatus Nitrosopelagicus sp.]